MLLVPLMACTVSLVASPALEVVNVAPPHGAANVDPELVAAITFNDVLDPATTGPDSLWIEDRDGTPLPAGTALDEDGWSVLLSPTGGLGRGATYTIVVSTSVAGQQLGPLPAELHSSFTTMGAGAGNQPPVADAGPDLADCAAGDDVPLDGTGSYDPEGWEITYSWRIAARPAGSRGGIEEPTTAAPTLLTDIPGDYVVGLVVNDGDLDGDEDYAVVSCE